MDCQDSIEVALQQMYEFSENPKIKAIVPLDGWPMFKTTGWTSFVDEYHDHNLILVVADALNPQIDLVNMGYADALVG